MTTIKVLENEQARDAYLKETSDRWMRGEIEKGKHTLVLTAVLFAKIFTPKRLELLLTLRKDESVSDMARRLKRPFEAVHRDLQLFKRYGLVRMRKEKRSVFTSLAGEIRMPVIHA